MDAPPDASPVIYSADSEHCIGACGNVMLLNWRGEYVPALVDAAERAHRDILARHPGMLSGLHIIEATSGLPPAEVRRRAVDMLRWSRAQTEAISVAILGEGFLFSTLQSVAISLFSITSRIRTRAHADIDRAIDWLLAEAASANVDAPTLHAAVREIRETTTP